MVGKIIEKTKKYILQLPEDMGVEDKQKYVAKIEESLNSEDRFTVIDSKVKIFEAGNFKDKEEEKSKVDETVTEPVKEEPTVTEPVKEDNKTTETDVKVETVKVETPETKEPGQVLPVTSNATSAQQ